MAQKKYSSFLQKLLLKNHGASLVETIIAVGIIAIVAASVASFISVTNRQVTSAAEKIHRTSLLSTISGALKRPDSCLRNLATINLGATPQYFVTTLNEYDEAGVVVGTIVPALNTNINPQSRIRATQMRVTGPNASGNPALVSTVGSVLTYSGNLVVNLSIDASVITLRPIIIPALTIKTNPAGVIQSCETETLSTSVAICASLGMTWDNVNTVCIPNPERACAAMGGAYNSATLKCRIRPATTMTCPPGHAVNRITAGVPVCEPIATGIWSNFSGCSASCGVGTQTRSCLIGTCTGPATQGCVYYYPPVMSCGFHLVDKIGDPPFTCGGGGGDMIFCSSTTCPPAGSRFMWSLECEGMYHGGSNGPQW